MSSSSDTPEITGAPIEIDVVDEAGDRPTLVVRGEIDVSTSPELRAQLGRLLEHQPSGIVVDLRGVGFVDSSGLGVLVGALKRLREAGGDDVVLLGVQEPVRKVFEITGLDRLFRLEG